MWGRKLIRQDKVLFCLLVTTIEWLQFVSAVGMKYNGSSWMSELPENLQKLPLKDIAIPGSHNSGTYSLNREGDIAPDQKGELKILLKATEAIHGGTQFRNDVIYRWSMTQDLNITEQLNLGIRYFDLRIAYREKDHNFYIVHGLYGTLLQDVLQQVNRFSNEHRMECIILDINHLYNIQQKQYKTMIDTLYSVIGTKLLPRMPVINVTLEKLWELKKSCIVFVRPAIEDFHNFIWTSQDIVSPFNKKDFQMQKTWIKALQRDYESDRSVNQFHVTQGIMVPNWLDITTGGLLSHGSLMDKADAATEYLVSWLRERQAGPKGLNIVTSDFIEHSDFIKTTLALNVASIKSTCTFLEVLSYTMIVYFVRSAWS